MQHLTAEALARLVDEPPDRDEAAHLEACPACREELDALRRQTAALGAMAQAQTPEPPAEHWTGILAGLAAAETGGADAALDDVAIHRLAKRRTIPWFRIAASVAIYTIGTATGIAMTRHAPAAASGPTPEATTSGATQPLVSAVTPAPASSTSPSEPAADTREADSVGTSSAQFASAPDASSPRLHPLPNGSVAATPAEALRAMRAAERAYVQAYSRYAELTDTQVADDPTVRLAFLESTVLTSKQALDRAPADPVINGYHLTAVAQRDAALRQVALKSNAPWF